MLPSRAVRVKGVPSLLLVTSSPAKGLSRPFSIFESVLLSRICSVLAINTKFLTICVIERIATSIVFPLLKNVHCVVEAD